MALSLALATEQDVATILQYMEDFYAIDQYPFDRVMAERNLHDFLRTPHFGRIWILKSNDQSIGYLILAFGYSFEYGGVDAFIDEFYLVPAFRGRGIGGETMESVSVQAKKLGVKALHLEVERTNLVGQKLYRQQGFGDKDRMLLTKAIN